VTLVGLEPFEYEWASHVGIRRYIENWGKKDARYYKKELMEDDRTAQVAAAVCEIAVAKLTNRYWSGHVWHASEHDAYKTKTEDVGKNIEVRRIRTGETAAVRKRQVGKGLVLFVAKPVMPELREVEVWGYIDYDRAWGIGSPAHYSPEDTRLIHKSQLTEYSG
jgi:hypothetical protein